MEEKTFLQEANRLDTTAEVRGSDWRRLAWAPDSAAYKCPIDLDVGASRQLFKLFEKLCKQKSLAIGSENQVLQTGLNLSNTI